MRSKGREMNEKSRFGLWISVLNRAAYKYYNKVLTPYGIGPRVQAYLISLLPGETVTQQDLADRLYVNKANVARAMKQLESRGYVRRVQSHADRRKVQVTLTDRGEQVRNIVEEKMKQWVDELRSHISPLEWEQMVSTIEKIARSAEACAEACDCNNLEMEKV
jgi:DNA-binding MarR family transcriptional regulator